MNDGVSSFPREQQLRLDSRLTLQTGNDAGASVCAGAPVVPRRSSRLQLQRRRSSATSLRQPEGSVTVHLGHLQVAVGRQLFFVDVVIVGKHLTDLHEGFVLGLRNDEEGVDGHSQADPAEDQVAVGTHCDLLCEETQH